MSRPKKTDDGKAREAMEQAFWNLLEKMPYKNITIKTLAAEAGVNHNTFYYHFKNMEDLALYCFDNCVKQEVLPDFEQDLLTLIHAIKNKDPHIYPIWRKVSLFTCRESDYLESVFKKALRQKWYTNAEVKDNKPDKGQDALMDFIESGIVILIAHARNLNDPSPLEHFLNSPFFSGVKEMIESAKPLTVTDNQ
ncbi:MAG: TetR/AcrR family transcriptional regulator [Sphaerochaetaceae bacterium]|nr:TetR/AcrR family transcriptional regulator [Sphaerochaetaceae bacterium]